MIATLPVSELEAQIHALSYEDKLRVARFTQREITGHQDDGDSLPSWMEQELLRREKLVEEGKMELVDADVAFARVRAKLGCASS